MTMTLLILGYIVVLVRGARQIRGEGSGLRRLLFAGLLGWSFYLALSGLAGWPRISVSTPYLIGLEPLGHALFQWLKGVSS